MASYCVSDIHGEYEAYLQLLEKLRFSDRDTLYVIGDMVDRGPQPMALVQDIMGRENVIALAGNHDLVACLLLRHLIYGGRAEDLTDDVMLDILRWRSDGGTSTLAGFQKLSVPERQGVLEWLQELDVYHEIKAAGETFVLVHGGLGKNFDPARPLDSYKLNDYLTSRADYGRVYFPDKFLVTGHTPTRMIPENPAPDRIYRANRHIAIDCGCTFGGHLGAICLETGEEFYV
ncbi:MAG: serine/threonine protein phosphatase [Clostridiales bacterium]|nr:serine/threonine protein phosphatase [Clostridiales bacterium]